VRTAFLGPLADGGFVGWSFAAAIPKCLHGFQYLAFAPLTQEGEDDAGTDGDIVIGSGVVTEIVEVIADLVGDAKGLAVVVQSVFHVVEAIGQCRTYF
jgi:hypothetical protein